MELLLVVEDCCRLVVRTKVPGIFSHMYKLQHQDQCLLHHPQRSYHHHQKVHHHHFIHDRLHSDPLYARIHQ